MEHFFKMAETRDEFAEHREALESVLGADFLTRLEEKRELLYLDISLNTFERQCQKISDLLIEKKLVLRAYEMRKSLGIW